MVYDIKLNLEYGAAISKKSGRYSSLARLRWAVALEVEAGFMHHSSIRGYKVHVYAICTLCPLVRSPNLEVPRYACIDTFIHMYIYIYQLRVISIKPRICQKKEVRAKLRAHTPDCGTCMLVWVCCLRVCERPNVQGHSLGLRILPPADGCQKNEPEVPTLRLQVSKQYTLEDRVSTSDLLWD